jgi:hypothetical protein
MDFEEEDTSPRCPLQRGTIKCQPPLEKGVIKSILIVMTKRKRV